MTKVEKIIYSIKEAIKKFKGNIVVIDSKDYKVLKDASNGNVPLYYKGFKIVSADDVLHVSGESVHYVKGGVSMGWH